MSGVADLPMGVSVEAHAQVVAMKAELVAELVAVKAELHGVRTDLEKLMTAVESIEAMVAARPGALATKTSTGHARCSQPGRLAGLASRRTSFRLGLSLEKWCACGHACGHTSVSIAVYYDRRSCPFGLSISI